MKNGFLFAAALGGLLAVACSSEKKENDMKAKDMKPAATKVKCMGINSCAGHGACASASNGCAGKNGCKGHGWMETASADECTAKGGKVM
jgi:uncharacterized membrane protein